MTFESKMQELDSIVSKLSQNDIPLDDAIVLFEKGLKLTEELDSQLKVYDMKIKELMVTPTKD